MIISNYDVIVSCCSNVIVGYNIVTLYIVGYNLILSQYANMIT